MKSYKLNKFKMCKVCGKVWRVESQNDNIKEICSRSCYYESLKGTKNPMWKQKIIKNCLNCEKTFSVWPSHSFRQFCSKSCSNKYRNK